MFRRFFDWLFGLHRPPDEPEVGGYFDVDTCDECGAELPPLEPGGADSTLCAWCRAILSDDDEQLDYDPDHCEECGRPLPDECGRFICDDCSDAKAEGGDE